MHWICCLFILIITSLRASEIITTNDANRIIEESEKLTSDSLVLFDVDATLISPDDAILKPKGKALFKELIAGCTDRDLFRDIRLKAPHSLVDARLINLTKKLQQSNIPVLAFTAAPAKIRGQEQPGDWRIAELRQHGFDFSHVFSSCNLLELPKSANQSHFPLFKSGVLFSSFHPKGDILIMFLQIMGLDPKKVIFVDDELEHVQSVVTSLDKRGINCLGIHYTAANEAVCDLNPERASFQVKYFITHDVWLSDDAVKQLLHSTEYPTVIPAPNTNFPISSRL